MVIFSNPIDISTGATMKKILSLLLILVFTFILGSQKFNSLNNVNQNKIEDNAPTFASYNGLKSTTESQTYIDPVLKLDYFGEHTITATGFGISYDASLNITYVLTNAHFCQVFYDNKSNGKFGYELPSVKMSLTKRFPVEELVIVDMDPPNDLCLMATPGSLPIAHLAAKDYEISQLEPVLIVGAPEEMFPMAHNTYVTNVIDEESVTQALGLSTPLLFVSDFIFHGESGSPVFNKDGKVIGIVVATVSDEKHLRPGGLVIPFQSAFSILDKNQVKY